MAILQISRIQVRRGLQEDLPQLASAELGWALDTRRLYIGNGTLEEGAPTLGNTELLTEYSDLTILQGTYKYSGNDAAPPGTSKSTERSWQSKFDDFVNVRDFGAKGDGTTNDADAFNLAIKELYKKEIMYLSDPAALRIRRTLYIPAGTYKLTGDVIRLLPYVKLLGDGKHATVIVQTDNTQNCVVTTVDSEGRTGNDLNNSVPNVIAPGFNEVTGITFVASSDTMDIVKLDSATNVTFTRVKMKGVRYTESELSTSGTDKACVVVDSSLGFGSSNLLFNDCDFEGQTYGFYTTQLTNAATVVGGSFNYLYRGVNLGEANSSGPTVGTQVSSVKVIHALFDNIYQYGIYAHYAGNQSSGVEGVTNIVSAFNTYRNVGYTLNIATPPQYSAVFLGGDNSYSFGDTFTHPYDGVKAVSLFGRASFASLGDGRLQLGRVVTAANKEIPFVANTAVPTLVGVIGEQQGSVILEYSILGLDSQQRTGHMKISSIGTDIVYDDEYVETTDMQIELTPIVSSAGVIELYYTSVLAAKLLTTTRTLV